MGRAASPSSRTGTSSARPTLEVTLWVSFAVRQRDGSRLSVNRVSIARPSMCQAATAASSRPGSANAGRRPTLPNALVSPGTRPTPCTISAGRRQHPDGRVAPSAAGAADHHDRIGLGIVQRLLDALTAPGQGHDAARGPDRLGDAIDGGIDHRIAGRPGALQPQARHPHAHPGDPGARKQRELHAAEPPARRQDCVRSGIAAARQDAFAGSYRHQRLRHAGTRRHRIERRHRIGIGRKRIADLDGHGGGKRRRRVGAGIDGELGSHRPAVAQRDRRSRERGRDDDIRRQGQAVRGGKIGEARIHRHDLGVDAGEHVVERRQAGDSLRGFGLRDHRRRHYYIARAGERRTSSTGNQMAEKTINLRGLKCPLPALRARKALTALAPGDLLVAECTDPLAAIDIPNLLNQTGDRLESSAQDGDVLVFRIRKR